MRSKPKAEVTETYEAPPPPYSEADDYDHGGDSSNSSDEETFEPHTLPSGGISLPCVIPQTTKHFKGAFFSPFVRAYIPELEAHNISQSDFLTFIDGLNEAFVASPVFQGLGIVGRIMGTVYGVQVVQWTGLGLEAGAGVASTATSYVRTMMYVRAMNKDLFHPAGLHLNIMSTKKMMAKVKYPEETLQLPPLEWSDDLGNGSQLEPTEITTSTARDLEPNDPRMRRIKALEGYVMPVDMNVPDSVPPDNLLKKMGAAQAVRMEKKQNKKLTKQRSKDEKRIRKAERRKEKRESRIEGFERELESNKAELDERITATKDQKEQRAVMKDIEKRNEKLQRKMEKRTAKMDRKVAKRSDKTNKRREKVDKKEHKTAHKVRWIVISQFEGDEGSSDDSLSASDTEVENIVVAQTENFDRRS